MTAFTAGNKYALNRWGERKPINYCNFICAGLLKLWRFIVFESGKLLQNSHIGGALLGVLKLQKLKYDYDPYYPKILPNQGHVPNTASVDWHAPR